MIACVNPDSVDVMFDDGTEEDAVDPRNVTLIAAFPEVPSSLSAREILTLASSHKQAGNDLLRQEAFVEVKKKKIAIDAFVFCLFVKLLCRRSKNILPRCTVSTLRWLYSLPRPLLLLLLPSCPRSRHPLQSLPSLHSHWALAAL